MARLSVSATIELTRSTKSNKTHNGLEQKLKHVRQSIFEKTSKLLKKKKENKKQSPTITTAPAAIGVEHTLVVEPVCRQRDASAAIRRKPVPTTNQHWTAPADAATQTDSNVKILESNFRALAAQLAELRTSLESLRSQLLEHGDGHIQAQHHEVSRIHLRADTTSPVSQNVVADQIPQIVALSSSNSSRGKTTYRNAAVQTEQVDAKASSYRDATVQTESRPCACDFSNDDSEFASLHDTKANSNAASKLLGKRSQKMPASPAGEKKDVDDGMDDTTGVGADRKSIASNSKVISASPLSSWMEQAVNGGRLGFNGPQQRIETAVNDDDDDRRILAQESKTKTQLVDEQGAGDVGGEGSEQDEDSDADTELDTSPSSDNDQQGGADLAALDPAIMAYKVLTPPPEEETAPVLHPDWNFVKQLKSGAQGRVCIVKHNHTGETRVAKTLKLTGGNQAAVDSSTSAEVYFLKTLMKHRNIIRLLSDRAIFDHNGPYFIQEVHYEYCEGGDLGDMIEMFFANGGRMPSFVVAHVFQSMLSALAYLHLGLVKGERGWIKDDTWWTGTILHRDIKPDNIFLRPGNNATGLPDVVLGDFGLAAVEGDCTIGGTEGFSAPEVDAAFKVERADQLAFTAMNKPAILTTRSDAFSLGATIYTTMTNREYHLFLEDRLLVSADGSSKHVEGESDGHKNILWTYVENLVRASPQRRSPSVAFSNMADELEGRINTWKREIFSPR